MGDQAGNVTPNHKLGGKTTINHINVSVPLSRHVS